MASVGVGRIPAALHLLEHEGHEHAAENLILAQDLMQRRLLFVSKRSESRRLVDDHGVGGDGFVLRFPQIVADRDDERRDVIEQAVGRKDVARGDRKDVEQPLEPSRSQCADARSACAWRWRRRNRS
jgi:hypothetical protein